MSKHYGHIVEMVIRRNGYNLSELAIKMHMSRRTFYNWFAQPNLKPKTIKRIGLAIDQDFSVQFPELFKSDDFKRKNFIAVNGGNGEAWKDKYLNLLEQYSTLLSNRVRSTEL